MLHIAALVAVMGLGAVAGAADRSAALVAEMRKRGWDDTVADYLEWVTESPLASEQFSAALPYELARTKAAQARRASSLEQRKRLLAEAAESFQKFAAAGGGSVEAIDALRESANLHAESGLLALAGADQLPAQAGAQIAAARTEARASLDAAAQAAEQVVALSSKSLAALPKATAIQSDPEAKSLRDKLRNMLAEARYVRALFEFEKARTYEAGTAEATAALDRASGLFGELYEEYRRTLVGVTSRFYQGRCAQQRGDFDQALGCYEDLVREQTSQPELRLWIARAHRYRVESLLALGRPEEAIRDAQDWLASSTPAERAQAPWLELAYRLADAYAAHVEQLPSAGAEARKLQSARRDLLRDVAQHANEFQTEARLAMSNGTRSAAATVGEQPKTFSDAFMAGKTALELMNSSLLAAKLARDNNPEAVSELESEAANSKAEALRLLQAALELADRQTPIAELNTTRYYLCWLYWQEGRLMETAVMGEYLARKFPEADFARGAANFAMAALEQLANQARTAAPESTGGFAAAQLVDFAEYVAGRWPSDPEGAAAVNILMGAALRESRLEDAEALLARLPEQGRATGELNLGAGLWTQYLRATAGETGPPDEVAIALREKAGSLLRSGFAGLAKSGAPSATTTASALYLAQYLLAKGEAAEAASVLENESAGPLTLVESDAEIGSRPELVEETFKVALRAYLSTDPPRRQKAKQMMTALEEHLAGADDGSPQQLTRMYVSLGLQLQRQVKELTAAGQDAEAKKTAAAFGDVLERVASRPGARDWAIRNWLAQTNLQIGQGLRGDEAKPYLDRAQAGYESMLAEAAKDKKFAPSAVALLAVRMRLGDVLLARGQYAQGLEQYGAILREKPNALDWQLAAATALQEWGVAKRDPKALDQAIRGAMPQADGKNLIWGWLRVAAVADMAKRQAAKAGGDQADSRVARYEDLFFEARYNVANARFQAAMIDSGDLRQKQLVSAKKNVASMAKLYPDLGGAKWKDAFQRLLAQINQELAKK